jgi:hypothetical protein
VLPPSPRTGYKRYSQSFRRGIFSESGLPVSRIFGSSESVGTAVRVVDYDAPASVRLSTQYV